MDWHFSDRTRAWAERQVTGDGPIEDRFTLLCEDELAAYGPHMGEPRRVVDLACGIGRVSAYLRHAVVGDETEFVLADSTGGDLSRKLPYGWDDESFYNDLDATSEFLAANGVEHFSTLDIRAEQLARLSQWPDLIISMLGVGFHVPLERCIEDLWRIARPDTRLIFGVGGVAEFPTWEGDHDFSRWFADRAVERFDSRYRTHEGRILMLGGKIQ